jgi:hypothetical protein
LLTLGHYLIAQFFRFFGLEYFVFKRDEFAVYSNHWRLAYANNHIGRTVIGGDLKQLSNMFYFFF